MQVKIRKKAMLSYDNDENGTDDHCKKFNSKILMHYHVDDFMLHTIVFLCSQCGLFLFSNNDFSPQCSSVVLLSNLALDLPFGTMSFSCK